MRQLIAWGTVFAAGALAGALSGEIVHAQGSQYATEQVLKTHLNNLPGQEMLIFASTWQPGFRLPLHMHPNGHEVTYVIEGEQTLDRETSRGVYAIEEKGCMLLRRITKEA